MNDLGIVLTCGFVCLAILILVGFRRGVLASDRPRLNPLEIALFFIVGVALTISQWPFSLLAGLATALVYGSLPCAALVGWHVKRRRALTPDAKDR